ncbi:hypothetical protein B0H14DRAFT_2364926 [Mycena olivaceomarginata]|nr:hypothetical protein B0H14DRAFT_2364926 [Mycena olivaceomarginata]
MQRGSGDRGTLSCTISTLNLTLLTSHDYVDLSLRRFIRPRFPTSKSNVHPIHYDPLGYTQSPFPEKCLGFFYYHRDPHAAPLEGSLRFRITPSKTPSSFGDGKDLLSPSGFPWQLILPQLASLNRYTRIHDQLLEERLITPDQVSRCREIFVEKRPIVPALTIFRLAQEFPVSLSANLKITAVGPDALYRLEYPIFARKNCIPWGGSAIVRFEPSTSPEYAGRRIVHLRIVKLLTPVSSVVDGNPRRFVVKPEEGELVAHFRDGEPHVWAYNIDDTGKVAAALRTLWDNQQPS